MTANRAHRAFHVSIGAAQSHPERTVSAYIAGMYKFRQTRTTVAYIGSEPSEVTTNRCQHYREPDSDPRNGETTMMDFSNRGGPELDAWVAKAEGLRVDWVIDQATAKHGYVIVDEFGTRPVPPYSTDDALANTIIQREGIEVRLVIDSGWVPPEQFIAWINRGSSPRGTGAIGSDPWLAETAAAAGMYCHVHSKLGDVWRTGSPIIN